MKFQDLNFRPHPTLKGTLAECHFANGYGVSVVRSTGSYGHESGLYEAAVLERAAGQWQLCYTTPLTSDVLGHLTESDVEAVLADVENLPMIFADEVEAG
jgi:hypothetical protein